MPDQVDQRLISLFQQKPLSTIKILPLLTEDPCRLNQVSLNYALRMAAKLNEVTVVNMALHKGALINSQDNYGNTALMYAVKNGHTEIVQKLIAAKADVNMQDIYGNTALRFATQDAMENKPDAISIINNLCQAGADPEIKNQKGANSESILYP